MNAGLNNNVIKGILREFDLTSLKWPIDLSGLAQAWGVTSVERGKINALAMLLGDSAGVEYRGGLHPDERKGESILSGDSNNKGYKIILQDTGHPKLSPRQRFSFAHELGHLLLKKSGGDTSIDDKKVEEQLCDHLAAEILMPRADFKNAGNSEGWTLKSLGRLAAKYEASREATAIRMVDLMPEPSMLGVWKYVNGETPSLRWGHSQTPRFRLPRRVPRGRQWLLSRALKSRKVEDGVAPVFAARTSRYPRRRCS